MEKSPLHIDKIPKIMFKTGMYVVGKVANIVLTNKEIDTEDSMFAPSSPALDDENAYRLKKI